jgi:hypothetical protein
MHTRKWRRCALSWPSRTRCVLSLCMRSRTHTETQRHRHTDTDRQTDRQTDTQTHTHTYTQTQTRRRRHADTHSRRHTQTLSLTLSPALLCWEFSHVCQEINLLNHTRHVRVSLLITFAAPARSIPGPSSPTWCSLSQHETIDSAVQVTTVEQPAVPAALVAAAHSTFGPPAALLLSLEYGARSLCDEEQSRHLLEVLSRRASGHARGFPQVISLPSHPHRQASFAACVRTPAQPRAFSPCENALVSLCEHTLTA